VPIEETIGAMAELVQQGKVRYLGCPKRLPPRFDGHMPFTRLLPCKRNTLWSRDPEDELLPTVRELGIGTYVARLGRGFSPVHQPRRFRPR